MVYHLPGLELWQYPEIAVGAGKQDAGSSESPMFDENTGWLHHIDPDQAHGHVLNFKEDQ